MHLRKSKTWDMCYYWLRDKDTQKQIKVYWKRGTDENDPNKADYHTKHHPIIHHRGVRPTYVRDQAHNLISSIGVRPTHVRDQALNLISSIRHNSSVLRVCIISLRDSNNIWSQT